MQTENMLISPIYENKIDSLNQMFSSKVDSLEKVISNFAASETYFQSILSHQWTLLSIQTALFILILTIVLSLALVVSWKTYFQRYNKKIKELENIVASIPDLMETIEETYSRSTRALYEMYPIENYWKIIWHIRYIKWFINNINGGKAEKIKEGLITRCKILEDEFNFASKNPHIMAGLKKFENKDGLISILIDLYKLEIKEVSSIASKVMSGIQ